MAEWLEHSAAKQKVAGSNPTRASGWKTPSVHPAVKWVPDLIQGRKGSGRRGMGSAFHMLCPRHSEPLTVRGHYALGPYQLDFSGKCSSMLPFLRKDYSIAYFHHCLVRYSGISPYGHLTSKVTSPLRSRLLSPKL